MPTLPLSYSQGQSIGEFLGVFFWGGRWSKVRSSICCFLVEPIGWCHLGKDISDFFWGRGSYSLSLGSYVNKVGFSQSQLRREMDVVRARVVNIATFALLRKFRGKLIASWQVEEVKWD